MTPPARHSISAPPQPLVCEHSLDCPFLLPAKTAIRRLAAGKEIDLTGERVSLWHSTQGPQCVHLASARSLYQAVQLAETFVEDLLLFDAPGDRMHWVAAGEGK